MKNFYLLLFVLTLTTSCNYNQPTPISKWKLIYKNDKEGKSVFGKKEDLLEAIQKGKEIRIGWGGRRVKHFANAKFLSITNGTEVFAQIDPIIGQRPHLDGDTLKINFRESFQWAIIVGTNGFSDRLNIDVLNDSVAGHRNLATEVSWFVESP